MLCFSFLFSFIKFDDMNFIQQEAKKPFVQSLCTGHKLTTSNPPSHLSVIYNALMTHCEPKKSQKKEHKI